eukprot:jgi/Mesvir1/10371/Mv10571-RA.1
MASFLLALLAFVARLWRLACRLGPGAVRGRAPRAVTVQRAYVSDGGAWFDVTERFRDWWAGARAAEATGRDLVRAWDLEGRVDVDPRPSGPPAGSLSVSYKRGVESFLVTYPLSCRIAFPPWEDEEETERPVDARTRLARKVLSATFGRSQPHAEDEDCTKHVARCLGPRNDFYSGAGLPQYAWAIRTHAEIEKSNRRALRSLGRRQTRGRLSAPPSRDDPADRDDTFAGPSGEPDLEKGGSADPPCFLRVIFGDGKTVVRRTDGEMDELPEYDFDEAEADGAAEGPAVSYSAPYKVLRAAPLRALLEKGRRDAWPERTDVCCWHCCHPFDGVPAALPVGYKQGKGFLVKGVFCSFACAKSYNMDASGAQRELRNMWLFDMMLKLWRSNPDRRRHSFKGVRPAPPRTCLKMFGGDMTIEEFRGADPLELHRLLDPPFSMDVIQQVHCVYAINEKARTTKRDAVVREPTVRDPAESKKRRDAEQAKLTLKRPRPSANPRHSLDKFLSKGGAKAPTVPIPGASSR